MTYPDSAPDPVEDLVAECLRRRSDDGTLPIDELCQQHPQLADELRARVRALQDMGMVSNAPAAPLAAPPDLQQVGPYRILDRLGEGGMGTVYLAEQKTPVRRRVALKVIKLGMDSKQVLARFEAERQALAMMEHDHIAKVFDAGTTDRGQPFFVMEYVKGVPFTEYCDTHRLSTRERLRLFQQVCDAVQHAHHKGVIHRDLKPSNILVTEHEGKANAKVIDFGLARATDHRLVEATIFTEHGQLLGTPEYMSPEQAEMTSAEVDTRTDVYSLGVLLYELLVGELPFSVKELRQAGLFELRRKIREEEPPRPSTRLSSLGEGSTATAQRRHTTAQMLLRELRGDLDWIVMRAMEKDRQRRYQTPRELEQEIGRFLANEPVLAGPPGVMYRLRKVIQRHRRHVVAVLLLTIAASLVGVAWLDRIAEARDRSTNLAMRIAAAEQALANRRPSEAEYHLRDALRFGLTPELDAPLQQRVAAMMREEKATANAKRLASLQENRRAWRDLTGTAPLVDIPIPDDVFGQVAVDGSALVVAGGNREGVRVIDTVRGEEILAYRSPAATDATVAVSKDGALLVIGAARGMLEVFGIQDGRLQHALVGHEGAIRHILLDDDRRHLLTADDKGEIRYWDLLTGTGTSTLKREGSVSSLDACADGRLAVAGYENGWIITFEPATGNVVDELRIQDQRPRVAMSRDGKRIAACGMREGIGLVRSVAERRTIHEVDCVAPPANRRLQEAGGGAPTIGTPSSESVACFLDDGRMAVVGHLDGDVTIWGEDGVRRVELGIRRSLMSSSAGIVVLPQAGLLGVMTFDPFAGQGIRWLDLRTSEVIKHPSGMRFPLTAAADETVLIRGDKGELYRCAVRRHGYGLEFVRLQKTAKPLRHTPSRHDIHVSRDSSAFAIHHGDSLLIHDGVTGAVRHRVDKVSSLPGEVIGVGRNGDWIALSQPAKRSMLDLLSGRVGPTRGSTLQTATRYDPVARRAIGTAPVPDYSTQTDISGRWRIDAPNTGEARLVCDDGRTFDLRTLLGEDRKSAVRSSFMPSGDRVLLTSRYAALVFAATTQQVLSAFRGGDDLYESAAAPDGSSVLSYGSRRVYVWSAEDGKLWTVLSASSVLNQAWFAGTSRCLWAIRGGRMRLIHWPSGNELADLAPDGHSVVIPGGMFAGSPGDSAPRVYLGNLSLPLDCFEGTLRDDHAVMAWLQAAATTPEGEPVPLPPQPRVLPPLPAVRKLQALIVGADLKVTVDVDPADTASAELLIDVKEAQDKTRHRRRLNHPGSTTVPLADLAPLPRRNGTLHVSVGQVRDGRVVCHSRPVEVLLPK